jgi:phosphate uptake regulator
MRPGRLLDRTVGGTSLERVAMTLTPIGGEHDFRRAEILSMSEKTLAMLQIVRDGFRKQQSSALGVAERLGREVHRHEKALMETLVTVADVSTRPCSDEDTVFVPMHLERVGDNIIDRWPARCRDDREASCSPIGPCAR